MNVNRIKRIFTFSILLLLLPGKTTAQTFGGGGVGSGGGSVTGGSCPAGQYTIAVGTDGAPTCSQVNWSQLGGLPSTFAPAGHNASHRDGGTDEVATVTPGAGAIPKAGGSGTLGTGWFPTLNQSTTGNAGTATALATNPANCPGGQAAGGIAASGAAEDCFTPAGGAGSYQVRGFSTLTSGTTVGVTASTNNAFLLVLGHNVATTNFTSPNIGQIYTFRICQPASGGPFTFTWPTGFTLAGTVTTVASGCSNQSFVWSSSSTAIPIAGMYETDIAGSAIVLSGSTSGTVTLVPPAVAGSTVLTFPGTTGTLARTADTVAAATNLAADPAACPGGQFASDIAANGTLTCGTPSGGGGGAVWTTGYCFLSTNCAPPMSALVSGTPTAVSKRVYVMEVVPTVSGTITKLGIVARGGGAAGDGFVMGLYASTSGAPGSLIGGCAITNTTSVDAYRQCTTSMAVLAGTAYFLAVAADDPAMSMRVFPGEFGAAAGDFLAKLTPTRIGTCAVANPATSSGSGLTLPASCGTFSASVAWPVPMILALP